MNILEKIVEQKRIEVSRLPKSPELADTRWDPRRGFLHALTQSPAGTVKLIAEVKKASPSAGVICPDFDPVRIARDYEAGGATCLSVLTDEKFFQGSLEYLKQIRQAVKLPLLRKDFIIDERQIDESLQFGADAILLIVAILEDDLLRRLHARARENGLDVLVEVHDEAELQRAVAIEARLIGINNRNLKSFQVDLATTEQLALRLKNVSGNDPAVLVAESGIENRAHVERVRKAGAQAILVGEALMRQARIPEKIAELIGAA